MSSQTSRLFTRSAEARSIGFLVAGAGSNAAQHMLAAIREQPPLPGTRDVAGAWVVALYSHSERRAREFAQRHAIIHFSHELDTLLQRPEIHCVYVGSHPRHHAETVRAALNAHKHVLCEPPLALTAAEAEPLVQMAQNRSLVLAMNYTWRAAAAIYTLHNLLLNDSLGELLGGRIQNTRYLPVAKQTWRLQAGGGGVLWDRTLHDLDLLRFLLHVPARELYVRATQSSTPAAAGGQMSSEQVPEEIVGHAVLVGGRAVQLYDSFVQSHVPVAIELYGTHATAVASACAPADTEAVLTLRRGDEVRTLPVAAVNAYRAGVANFLAAVRGTAPALATGADELHNLAALAAAEQSLAAGHAVRVTGPG